MKIRTILSSILVGLFFVTQSIAAGGQDTMNGQNGQGQNGENGTEQMTTEGTVAAINPQDSTIILESEGQETDTIYYDEETMIMGQEPMALQEGSKVRIEYVEENGKKVAKRIEMTDSENGNGTMPEDEPQQEPGDGMEQPDEGYEGSPETP